MRLAGSPVQRAVRRYFEVIPFVMSVCGDSERKIVFGYGIRLCDVDCVRYLCVNLFSFSCTIAEVSGGCNTYESCFGRFVGWSLLQCSCAPIYLISMVVLPSHGLVGRLASPHPPSTTHTSSHHYKSSCGLHLPQMQHHTGRCKSSRPQPLRLLPDPVPHLPRFLSLLTCPLRTR
jgi:hypothetical protein